MWFIQTFSVKAYQNNVNKFLTIKSKPCKNTCKRAHCKKKVNAILEKNNSLSVNPLSDKFIKWSNTLKQFVGKLPTNCLSVFDHFSGLALKG